MYVYLFRKRAALLDPALLSGEGGYFLTVFSSAVQVLKTFTGENLSGTGSNTKSSVEKKNAASNEKPSHNHAEVDATGSALSESHALYVQRLSSIADIHSLLRIHFPQDKFGRVFKTFPVVMR